MAREFVDGGARVVLGATTPRVHERAAELARWHDADYAAEQTVVDESVLEYSDEP